MVAQKTEYQVGIATCGFFANQESRKKVPEIREESKKQITSMNKTYNAIRLSQYVTAQVLTSGNIGGGFVYKLDLLLHLSTKHEGIMN